MASSESLNFHGIISYKVYNHAPEKSTSLYNRAEKIQLTKKQFSSTNV